VVAVVFDEVDDVVFAFFSFFFFVFFFAGVVVVVLDVTFVVVVVFDVGSAANTTPTERANANAVKRAVIFFMYIHLLPLIEYGYFNKFAQLCQAESIPLFPRSSLHNGMKLRHI